MDPDDPYILIGSTDTDTTLRSLTLRKKNSYFETLKKHNKKNSTTCTHHNSTLIFCFQTLKKMLNI